MREGAHSKIIGFLWLALTALLALIFAVGLHQLGKLVPWSVENHLASILQSTPIIKFSGRSTEAITLLEKIKTRLYPIYPDDRNFTLNINIIPGNTVNAFAVLGGNIYVYNGLVKQADSPEELAGVLAHEIEHVVRRHIIQGAMVRILTLESLKLIFAPSGGDPALFGFLLNMRFSREQEHEADEGGLKRLHDGKINVQGFQDFFERMHKTSNYLTLLSDHPGDETRAELAQKYKNQESLPLMSQKEWAILKRICN
jgi:predicted Zn-dependent protease